MQTTKDARSLRAADVAVVLGVSRATIWRWAAERGDFPRPMKLSPRVTVWRAADILDWRERQGAGGAEAA